MQCFQKDPNLRVSARKLLKHPWIVNARRSDSVVPKKSTEYEEAVKSVQEWNEALKSPNSSSLRKHLRQGYTSPGPGQKEFAHPLTISAKELLSGLGTKDAAEKLRSPEGVGEDNWDDDFASAISPSALQLPHLKPHDNFGGMLSSEKLKAFASLESAVEQGGVVNSHGGGDMTVKSSPEQNGSDPLQTIRPFVRKLPEEGHSSPNNSRRSQRKYSIPMLKNGPVIAPGSGPAMKPVHQPRPAAFYKESSIEDYSDLIVANDAVLESKLAVIQVRSASLPDRPLLTFL
jgi:hypothetical protein